MLKNKNSRSNDKERYLKYCRHVLQGRNCRVGRCPYIHDLNVRIPCPFEGKGCKFVGKKICKYEHQVNRVDGMVEDLKSYFHNLLDIKLGYEFSKLGEKLERVQQKKSQDMRDNGVQVKVEDDLIKLPKFEVVMIVEEKDLKFHTEEVGSQSSGKVEKRLDFDGVPESSGFVPNLPSVRHEICGHGMNTCVQCIQANGFCKCYRCSRCALRHGICGCTQSGCMACVREGFCEQNYCSRCMPSPFNTPVQRGRGRVWSGRRGDAGWNSGRSDRAHGTRGRGRGRPPGRFIPPPPPKW